jgi:hypothetical protein
MLGLIAGVLTVLSSLGFLAFQVSAGLVHLLLSVGIVLLALHFLRGSSRTAQVTASPPCSGNRRAARVNLASVSGISFPVWAQIEIVNSRKKGSGCHFTPQIRFNEERTHEE